MQAKNAASVSASSPSPPRVEAHLGAVEQAIPLARAQRRTRFLD